MSAKKLFSIFVLMVFLVSMVPLVAAESDGNGGETRQTRAEPVLISADDSDDDTADEDGSEVGIRTRERLKDGAVAIRTRAKSYQEAKERYVQASERYTHTKRVLAEKRVKLQECKGDEGEECTRVRKETKLKSKEFLGDAAGKVLTMLERVRTRIEESDMDEEAKAEALAELDEKIEEVEDAEATLEDLDEESSQEDIRESARTIRNAWMKSEIALKRNAGKLMNEKIHGILVRAEKLSVKLERIRERLESKGIDVSALDSALGDFETSLGLAKENYENARNQYRVRAEGDVDQAMQNANRYMKEAHKHLRAAHQSLMEAFRAVKAYQGGQEALESPDEDEVEDEEETEEEDEEEAEDEESDDDTEDVEVTETSDLDEDLGDNESTEGNETA